MSPSISFAGFLFDENIPAVFADALKLVGYRVTSTRLEGLNGKLDPDVLRHCADRNLVWWTKDWDARRKNAYAGLVDELGVSAVFVRAPSAKGWTAKEEFETIVRNLRVLEGRYATARQPRFFVCRSRGQPLEARTFAARPGRS